MTSSEAKEGMSPDGVRTDALTEIRGLVASCRSPLLDRRIIHDDRGVVSRLIELLTEETQWPLWIDVPLSAVVGLQRVITEKGETWREALAGLTAQDWDSRVFDYWAGELRDQVFPASKAYRALRLHCHAGAVLVENGAHRMTAGMAWLCATRGDNALLQRARVRIHAQRGMLVDELVELARSSHRVDVAGGSMLSAELREVAVYFVRARSARGVTVTCAVNVNSGRLEQAQENEIEAFEPMQWERLPDPLVEAWANRSWLAHALSRAERCPTLTA